MFSMINQKSTGLFLLSMNSFDYKCFFFSSLTNTATSLVRHARDERHEDQDRLTRGQESQGGCHGIPAREPSTRLSHL